MKTTLTFLLSILLLTAYGRNATYEKLCDVNKCWREQKDVAANLLPQLPSQNEREWIRTHLALVENVLRKRNTDDLSATAWQNRQQCLDHLHEYMLAGRFPINEDYTYRTPIFIDKHDNFCAVGYLVKASGNEYISRKISASTNLAYVREMNYPELGAWAKENGFTIDELAWIQPGYPPTVFSAPVGGGVNGTVQELYVEGTTNRLFVGGDFNHADGTIPANNVAYVTESGGVFTWHNMGTGVNGQVNAITGFGGNIFVAGSFTTAGGNPVNNVAYWNGSTWHAAGCITGTVNDLVVFGGDLYAAGAFDVCGTPNVNFAKWNGTAWQPLPGLTGRINTMEVMGTTLLLGGAFNYGMSVVNAIKWDATSGFQLFTNKLNNEVKDFEFFSGNIYAACRHTHASDSLNLLVKLIGNTWYSAFADPNYALGFYPVSFYYDHNAVKRSFNTLCAETGSLSLGGEFIYAPMLGTNARNTFNVAAPAMYGTTNWFLLDSGVNKMVLFNNNLIAGGTFKTGYGGMSSADTLNGMARRYVEGLTVKGVDKQSSLRIYPNPVGNGKELVIENDFTACHFTLRDVTCRIVKEGELASSVSQQVIVPSLPAGIYLFEARNKDGVVVTKKVSVE